MDTIDGATAQDYRINMVELIHKEITDDRDRRRLLIQKFNRCCTIVDIIQQVLIVSTIGLGASSLGLMLTAVGLPIALTLDVGVLVIGTLSIANNRLAKYLRLKLDKHETIRTLGDATLCLIGDAISMAIEHDEMSVEEYTKIVRIYKDYQAEKAAIRSKTRKIINDQKTEAGK